MSKTRIGILSWLAYLSGGHNASGGLHTGRLPMCVDIDNDEKVAYYLYNEIKKDGRLHSSNNKKSLFVSVNYVGRYKDMIDKDHYSYIIDDKSAPKNQEELDDLEQEIIEWLKEFKQFDSCYVSILNFQEVGEINHGS